MTRKLYYLLGAFAIIVADQLSKWLVMEKFLAPAANYPSYGLWEWYTQNPEPLPYTEINVLPFFNLVMVWNKGISFGLFNQESEWGPLILIAVSLIITAGFTVWLFKSDMRWQNIAIMMVIGGALGNVIDRFRFGAVIDFLDFHIADLHWPAFNVSDSSIVIGVFLLILYSFSPEYKAMIQNNQSTDNQDKAGTQDVLKNSAPES